MSGAVFAGDTSGSITVQVPAVAGTNTLTLPANTGTILTTGSTASISPSLLTQPLTAGTAVTTTSGTSTIITGIPSWAKRVTMILSGVSTSGASTKLFQVGTSGGIASSGYGASGAYVNGGNSCNYYTSSAGIPVNSGSASDLHHGTIVWINISGNTWVATANICLTSGAAFFAAGSITLSGVLDRVSMTTVGGTDTFDAGSINILYE